MRVAVNLPDSPHPLPVDRLERAVRRTLARGWQSPESPPAGEGVPRGEISVTLLGDPAMAALNREYLGHSGTTDVISFPLEDPTGSGMVLGDVYLGWEQALRQAEEEGVAPEEELVRLAIHGTLHVLGYDHPEGPERVESPMYVLQESIVGEVME